MLIIVQMKKRLFNPVLTIPHTKNEGEFKEMHYPRNHLVNYQESRINSQTDLIERLKAWLNESNQYKKAALLLVKQSRLNPEEMTIAVKNLPNQAISAQIATKLKSGADARVEAEQIVSHNNLQAPA